MQGYLLSGINVAYNFVSMKIKERDEGKERTKPRALPLTHTHAPTQIQIQTESNNAVVRLNAMCPNQ
jgi:hypothetical protein